MITTTSKTVSTDPTETSRRGFTLLEMVAAVIILAIAAAIALPTFFGLIGNNSQQAATQSARVAANEAFDRAYGAQAPVNAIDIYTAYAADYAASATSVSSGVVAGTGGTVKYSIALNNTTYNVCVTFSGVVGTPPVLNGIC